jgi:4-hydroxybenzoate polyprenyltransferase
MIGVGIALVVVGIILLFMLPWVGIVLGIVGIVLSVLYFAGFARRGVPGEKPADRPR